ncbi:MAG: tetratricopeptide repeat protein [Rhodospirillales bacterium]|jgi:Flp pilus assembly protein TadD|nr:tetratricopeptide repeat protein [Rhodospirillales bacterium]MBT5076350.1 tetratricopeptide repeat protein [Rhodospirillales bacterium]MBT5113401.1 tetratricopeptide repeat protein [Rhodospirillales bacterium]MBT6187180.1 tetratricopeptide repeat protein [Rhodospirillales bacterium]MBT7644455.1 tetratricopeptide repeat protein [Rhodospirillales bacterium]
MRDIYRLYQKRLLLLGMASLMTGCATTDPAIRNAGNDPIEQMTTRPGGTAGALSRVARAMRDAGDPYSAINVYKRAHAADPENGAILVELAETLAAAGAYDEARNIMAKAVRIEPTNTRAIRGFANILISMGEPALAIPYFEEAITIHAQAATHNGHGVALDQINKPAEAKAAYRAGLSLAPGNASLKGNLALSLALTGDHDGAIALLSKMVRQGASTPRIRQNLALIYGLVGRNTNARILLRIDLDERSVANNIAYYEMVRGMASAERRKAVLGIRTTVSRSDAGTAAQATAVKRAKPNLTN